MKAKQIGTVLVLTARDKLQDELHALDLGDVYKRQIYFSRLKGLYQMVGEIVSLIYGLCKRKSKLNICRDVYKRQGATPKI